MKDILFEIAENKRMEIKANFPSDKFLKRLLSEEEFLLPTYSLSESIINKPGV